MRINKDLTDTAIIQALGQRIGRYRLNEGLTQSQLAEQAGIGKRTLERIEAGAGAELLTLVKVLRVLNLVQGLDVLVPELTASPIDQLKLQGQQRQRVGKPRKSKYKITHVTHDTRVASPITNLTAVDPEKTWKWGENK